MTSAANLGTWQRADDRSCLRPSGRVVLHGGALRRAATIGQSRPLLACAAAAGPGGTGTRAILGGSSSINGMMYHRGHPADFDQWAAETGEPGWDYAHGLPYFQRHEHVLTADPEGIRGHAGPQILEPAEARGPLFDAFFAAASQAGHRVATSIDRKRVV